MANPIIQFDFDGSPYGQKSRLALALAGVPFQRCDVPFLLPRKGLEQMGITYRRIPLLAVGKDIYCDTSLITDTVNRKLAPGKLPTAATDKAWEAWANATFVAAVALMPAQRLTPEMIKDRQTVFSVLKRPDYDSLRPSAIAEFRSRCAYLENHVLTESPYLGGDRLATADVHVIYVLRWTLFTLGAKDLPGCGKDAIPKVWKLVESVPEVAPEVISSERAIETILSAEYTAPDIGIASDDPMGIPAGTAVTVESTDSEPGKHPQAGKLVGCGQDELVIELDNGIHLHFPRQGYFVRKA